VISTSTHAIEWIKPEISEERWEFFHHPDKQDYYRRHVLAWDHLLADFDYGRLVAYPRSNQIGGVPVTLSYDSYDDYARYLAKAKRGYRKNYAKMEEELQRCGTLTMKAPIILLSAHEALLFSGYRRLCLAWNYGIVPYVWLVQIRQGD
jgi:hypothetical protein